MQFDTAFDDDQAKAGSRMIGHVVAALERVEKPGLMRVGNADAMIANEAHRFAVAAAGFNDEAYRAARMGILDRVAQQVGEDMAQQPFVAARDLGHVSECKLDGATAI